MTADPVDVPVEVAPRVTNGAIRCAVPRKVMLKALRTGRSWELFRDVALNAARLLTGDPAGHVCATGNPLGVNRANRVEFLVWRPGEVPRELVPVPPSIKPNRELRRARADHLRDEGIYLIRRP